MPGPTTISRGNIAGSFIVSTTLSPVSVAWTTTTEQTFTVTGLQLGDFINVSKPTTQPGLGIVNSRVSAANTLAVTFQNVSSATITPTAAELYTLSVDRPDNLNAAGTGALLSQIV